MYTWLGVVLSRWGGGPSAQASSKVLPKHHTFRTEKNNRSRVSWESNYHAWLKGSFVEHAVRLISSSGLYTIYPLISTDTRQLVTLCGALVYEFQRIYPIHLKYLSGLWFLNIFRSLDGLQTSHKGLCLIKVWFEPVQTYVILKHTEH